MLCLCTLFFQYDIFINALKIQYFYPDLIELQNAPLTYSFCFHHNFSNIIHSLITWQRVLKFIFLSTFRVKNVHIEVSTSKQVVIKESTIMSTQSLNVPLLLKQCVYSFLRSFEKLSKVKTNGNFMSRVQICI